MDKRLFFVLASLVLVLPVSSNADDGKPWDAAVGTATITGTVKFSGKKPRARPIDT